MKTEKSCGAVLYTYIQGIRHYVLVSSKREKNCGLPKGHMEGAETEKETAVREIEEETLVRAEILDGFQRQIEYITPKGSKKTVVYFIAYFSGQEAKKNPAENADVFVLPLQEAINIATFDEIKEILKDADGWLSKS